MIAQLVRTLDQYRRVMVRIPFKPALSKRTVSIAIFTYHALSCIIVREERDGGGISFIPCISTPTPAHPSPQKSLLFWRKSQKQPPHFI